MQMGPILWAVGLIRVVCRLVYNKEWAKEKGCDVGYALAANSCERVRDVDACTVTAFDAITVFTVPNPGVSSQIRRFFQVWSRASRPALRITQPTSDWQLFLKPTLSAVDATNPTLLPKVVNAEDWCNQK